VKTVTEAAKEYLRALDSRSGFDPSESVCLRALAELRDAVRAEWDGRDRRCEHQMKWISDWYGDSSIPNGTADCSRLECEQCGWVDPNGEAPEIDYEV
jgi:hypothetical protein